MRRARAIAAGLAAVFGAILAPAAAQAAPATFTVTSSGDSGAGTLRQAILDANANANPGDVDTIAFNIAPSGFHVLSITSAPLPGATEPVKIDGLTQPGSSPDNPRIVLVGSAPTANGLFLSATAKGSTVSGLIIQSFPGDGIAIAGDGTTVTGCWVGINAAGARAPNGSGILVESAKDVSIAQTAAGRNVVSGNSFDGILVHE